MDGILGDFILLGPAFTITEEQINELVDKLDSVLTNVERFVMDENSNSKNIKGKSNEYSR